MRIPLLCCVFLLLGSILACTNNHQPNADNRGFYYWKTGFSLTNDLRQKLLDLKVSHLYIKLFDVAWDQSANQAVPVGILNRKDSFPQQVQVTPVVFITNEALRNTTAENIPILAGRVSGLVQKLTADFANHLSNEIQLDCDWTVQTKESYFSLLKELKKQAFFQKKLLSVTIRLHQVKYINESGVPPADRGLLMCYNMGNLRDPKARNSIIDPAVFKSYTGRLNDYPLSLDMALPLFDWWVWFRNHEYYGLVHAGNLPQTLANGQSTDFQRDTVINGYHFLPGDRLRHENSAANSIGKLIDLLPKRYRSGKTKLILFHLDSASLKNYSIHELEDFYRHFD